jgi:uncharacterized membrane protein (UPF0127 family)
MALIARNLDTGSIVADRIDVADTRATRAVGLLPRNGLEPGEGLWIVPSRGVHTCWMRFPIDVIALDERGVIIDRVTHLKPWRIRLPRRGTAGVLELRAGTLDESNTRIGHRIELARQRPETIAAAPRQGISLNDVPLTRGTVSTQQLDAFAQVSSGQDL